MLSVVCFDLMGTLVRDPYPEAVQEATGLAPQQLAAVKDPGCWPSFELGQIDEAEFARRFFADPGRRFDLDTFNRVRRQGYRILPGMIELLERLQGGIALHVASNYPIWIEELRATFQLDRYFDGVWASHQFAARKPDPVFFERLLDKVGRPAPECLFVDDREDNCRGARQAGLQAHRFVDAGLLEARLRAEGLLH